jgi:hypothetical protein
MPIGLHPFDGWRSITQATLTVYSLQRLPIDGLGLDPARGSRLWSHGIMPPSSNGARRSRVALQALHRQTHIELCVR